MYRKGCEYHEGRQNLVDNAWSKLENGIGDIEDFVKLGHDMNGMSLYLYKEYLTIITACPYYALKKLAAKADIVFCPYTYLINPTQRKAMGIKLDNAIIIIDEAQYVLY